MSLLGIRDAGKVKKQHVVNDHKFYWIMEIKDINELKRLTKKCVMGDKMIKSFYKKLFKLIDVTNKLGGRLGKGMKWFINRIKKQFRKKYGGDLSMLDDMLENAELQEGQLIIKDRKEIEELMKKELIKLSIISK
jgi:hypothetical protein